MLPGSRNLRKLNHKSRGSPRPLSAPPVMVTNVTKAKKRKLWSNESMCAAMKAVKNGMNVRRAAVEHGVPRMTLRDRITGRVVHGTKPGPKPRRSLPEEKETAAFMVQSSTAEYGKKRKQKNFKNYPRGTVAEMIINPVGQKP